MVFPSAAWQDGAMDGRAAVKQVPRSCSRSRAAAAEAPAHVTGCVCPLSLELTFASDTFALRDQRQFEYSLCDSVVTGHARFQIKADQPARGPVVCPDGHRRLGPVPRMQLARRRYTKRFPCTQLIGWVLLPPGIIGGLFHCAAPTTRLPSAMFDGRCS